MTPIRFIVAAFRALFWFLLVSVESIIYSARRPQDMGVSHRYARRMGEGFTRAFRLRYSIKNGEQLTKAQPCIYLVNHRSNLDVVTLAPIFPARTIIIGKRALLKIPFFGKIYHRSRNITIDRKDPEDSRAGMAAAERALAEEKLSVWVFPEGTRNYGKLKPFKKGAFHLARNTGAFVLPIVCAVPNGWLDGRRLFLRPSTQVKIEVLEPIDPKGFESVDAMIEKTHQVMREALAKLESELDK